MPGNARRAVLPLALLLALGGGTRAEEGTMTDAVATGTFWYAMAPEGGEPTGYARLVVTPDDASGGLDFDWSLAVASRKGNYEETRHLVLDGKATLVESEMRAFGNLVCRGRRADGAWKVTTVVDGKTVEREAEPPPAGALTGLAFPLAAMVPTEEGGTLVRPELDEANGLRPLGEVRYVWQEALDRTWEGRSLRVHLVVLHKPDGRVLRVQVDEQGRVVEVDWGGGMRMLLSSESTEDLYEKVPPVLSVIEAGGQLVMEGDLEAFAPEDVLAHFLDPERMARFWAPKAEIEPEVGGRYRLSWPGPGWTMDGKVLALEKGALLAFSWRWTHRPKAPDQRVDISCQARPEGGTHVRLVQGPYRESEEDAVEREGHRKGWETTFAALCGLR